MDGQDVFATIRENSHTGELIAELISDTTGEGVRWSLNGKDADWFFLDRGKLRLNTSPEKVLDREVNALSNINENTNKNFRETMRLAIVFKGLRTAMKQPFHFFIISTPEYFRIVMRRFMKQYSEVLRSSSCVQHKRK